MYKLTASQIHEKFRNGDLKAEAIAAYFLKRIHAFDPKIGAFLRVYDDRVLEKARLLDQKRAQGKPFGRLAAIPIGIKDNIHVNGEITSCASKFLVDYRAPFDATATKLLELEDALIIGKTNLDEFAMGSSNENSALQKTFNPWDLSCVPGGSSGGSAAAVAARLCPVALGSDTGGSVRQPAGFCGVVGFKPTYGRVSRYGLVAFGSSLDQIGPLTNSLEDIGKVMEVIGKRDKQDATTLSIHPDDYLSTLTGNIEGKRIGIPYAFLEGLDPQTRASFDNAIETLKGLGCKIVEIDLNILKYSVATYYIIATAEASTNLARFDGIRYGVRAKGDTLEQIYDRSRTQGFGSEVKKRIFLGTYVLSAGYQDAYYKQAMKVRAKIVEQFDRAYESCDCIATPVSPTVAFKAGAIQDPIQMYLQDIYTIGVNLARLPAISVPCALSSEKMPLGLQLIGNRRDDVLVCRIAHAYEKKNGFKGQIPRLFDQEASS